MASFDDDAGGGSNDEFDNEDEEMDDVNDPDQDQDQDQEQGQDDEGAEDEEDDDNEEGEADNDEEEEDEQNDSPLRRTGEHRSGHQTSNGHQQSKPELVPTSPSPHASPAARSPPSTSPSSFIPLPRAAALTALAYDIVPTIAAPQSTSINAVATTPDMRWVFSGGSDGYVRMYNWVETANGKVPLTVAQKHPFVDSVMKAGSLVTYWENEEALTKTPPTHQDEGKWTSPVYSLAVQHQAVWLLSGLESGGINLQTCRHQAGTRITTLKEHTSAVSVLTLARDETSVLSGSWDKTIHDWDLQTGTVKRSFRGIGGQVSAIQIRPSSSVPIPEVTETVHESLGTFTSNNADRPTTNGIATNGPDRRASKGGEEDAMGSPSSLFGEDHGSLFGEDTAGGGAGGGNAFGDDEDDLARALADGIQGTEQSEPGEQDTEMGGIGSGGPVQPPEPVSDTQMTEERLETEDSASNDANDASQAEQQTAEQDSIAGLAPNGLPHSDEPLTAPPTDEPASKPTSVTDLPPQSESTFLDAAFDGTIRIWDRRIASPIATIAPYGGTPPWCTGACWSPDGNYIYAGRRNCIVDEFSIHKMSTTRNKPERIFRFQQGSGPVYAVQAMPNGRHLVCASQDILRIYDLKESETSRHRTVPFTIIPGHRGGVISAVHVDPTCRYMLSAAGNRGWESTAGTEVLLGYEIGVQDQAGIWHK